MEEDGRIHITNNGYALVFDYIVPADEEYYICGIRNEDQGTFQSLNSYFIYVKSK